jgi:hypothetical protein
MGDIEVIKENIKYLKMRLKIQIIAALTKLYIYANTYTSCEIKIKKYIQLLDIFSSCVSKHRLGGV